MTKASFKVIIDDREIQDLLKDLETKLPRETAKVTFQVGQDAKNLAKSVVPVDSGKTKQGIISMVKINNKNQTEVIVGFISNPHPEKTWDGQEFSLPAWMTYSPNAINHNWHNGKNPRFLQFAAERIEQKFGTEIDTATDFILGR